MQDPLKRARKIFRSWKNNIRLKLELNDYNSKFKSMGLKVPGDSDIRQIFKSKYPELKPKPKGDLNILAIYHHYNWENESLKPSLEKFGTVRHYDWFEEFNHQEKNWFKSVRNDMNHRLTERIKRWVGQESVDVIFTYLSGEIVLPDTVKMIAGMGVPIVNLCLNDKEAFTGKHVQGFATGSRDICRHFDLCWTSTKDALEKYCVEGAVPIYLPEGANPEIHKPYDLEQVIDVSFVGQRYGNRPEIIRRLQHQGIQVEIYGYGWPNGPLATEEMIKMYSRSKINLGFSGVGDITGTYCLKGRDFEIPMSGGLYLTEYHPELENFFKVGQEIVTYNDVDDLISKVRFLLANPKEADAVRKRGYQRSRREHTWEMRFEKIFGLMGLLN